MSTCPSLIHPERPLHPLPTIDFYPEYFHQLTNPSSRNSFLFSSIQNPRGVGVSPLDFSSETFKTSRLSRHSRRSLVFACISKLFVAQKKLKSFAISKIQTLSAKHRGWGYPATLKTWQGLRSDEGNRSHTAITAGARYNEGFGMTTRLMESGMEFRGRRGLGRRRRRGCLGLLVRRGGGRLRSGSGRLLCAG